jgi:hypothetical protein
MCGKNEHRKPVSVLENTKMQKRKTRTITAFLMAFLFLFSFVMSTSESYAAAAPVVPPMTDFKWASGNVPDPYYVTDSFVLSRVVQLNDDSTTDLSETYFTATMPLATIWIDEAFVNTKSYQLKKTDGLDVKLKYSGTKTGLKLDTTSTDDSYGQLYFDFGAGSLSYGTSLGDDLWAGDVAEYRFKNAAEYINKTTGTIEKGDLIITYSNLRISLQGNSSLNATSYANLKKLNILDANYFAPTMFTKTGAGDVATRAGVRFDVNMKVVDSSDNLINGSFYFPAVDLNVRRRGADFGSLYEATKDNNESYSEHIMLLGNYGMPTPSGKWDEKIWIPGGDFDPTKTPSQMTNMPYMCKITKSADGKYLIISPSDPAGDGSQESTKISSINRDGYNRPTPNTAGSSGERSEDFYTGFATLANNTEGGVNFRMWSTAPSPAAEWGGNTTRSYILCGPSPVNHYIKGSSGEGGTIYTTSTGNANGLLNTGDLMGTDNIDTPYSISSATGQSVTYTMMPRLGYRLKAVYVKTGALDVMDDYKAAETAGDLSAVAAYKPADTDIKAVSGGYTYTFDQGAGNRSIHVVWEPSELAVEKQVTTGRTPETFTFHIKFTAPATHTGPKTWWHAKAWNNVGAYPDQDVWRLKSMPLTNKDTGGYLMYDRLNGYLLGWDGDGWDGSSLNGAGWVRLAIDPSIDLTDSAALTAMGVDDSFIWQNIEIPVSWIDPFDMTGETMNLIYNKKNSVFPNTATQDVGTPLIWDVNNNPPGMGVTEGIYIQQTAISASQKYLEAPPYTANPSAKLAFEWNSSKNTYLYRSYETAGKCLEVRNYEPVLEKVTIPGFAGTPSYLDILNGLPHTYGPAPGTTVTFALSGSGDGSFIVQLPSSETYTKAQLISELSLAGYVQGTDYDDCSIEKGFGSDGTTLQDLVNNWNTANPSNHLTLVTGTTDTYSFKLTVNAAGTASVNLVKVVPFGWSYKITEVDKDGNDVAAGGVFVASAANRSWRLLSAANANGTLPTTGTAPDAVFANEQSVDLTVAKDVKGIYGSKERYFRYTVELFGLGASSTYTIDLSSAETTTTVVAGFDPAPHTNPTSVTSDASGDATFDVWLRHGQRFTVKGVPFGAAYTVKETVPTSSGYVPSTAYLSGDSNTLDSLTVTGSPITMTTPANSVTDTYLQNDASIRYSNELKAAVPTGVYDSTNPALWIFALAMTLGVLAAFGLKRKHSA